LLVSRFSESASAGAFAKTVVKAQSAMMIAIIARTVDSKLRHEVADLRFWSVVVIDCLLGNRDGDPWRYG
jgi:hypothetical protein